MNRLHRAKEHSMVDRFVEGGRAGNWKIALFRMFPFTFFFFQNGVALYSFLNFYHLVLKKVVFFQEKIKPL